jgi:hypothetical protein
MQIKVRPSAAKQPPSATPKRAVHNLNGYNKSDVSQHTLRRTFGSHLLNNGLQWAETSTPVLTTADTDF